MRQFQKYCTGLILGFFLISLHGAQDAYCQQYYKLGDASHDGWCNMADIVVLTRWISGCTGPNFCPEGADANGSGTVNGLDLTYLISFLIYGGPSPIRLCPDVIVTCDNNEQAEIWLIPVTNSNSDQATFEVYIEASSDVYAINFTFKYDPADIAGFSFGNLGSNVFVSASERSFVGGENIVAFLIDPGSPANGGSYPMGIGGTRIFDITVDAQQGAPNSLLRIVEDPIHGPPYFYFASSGNCAGDDIICPFSPTILPCDANNSGDCNGLDVTYLVNYFKGIGPGPTGKYFYNVPVWWNY
ncbi:MAG: hypothetical protein JSW64_02425 [Candidatus Zixiibacteriota bacterium]|nr:MAG: hypothetical protein JSW64_02425 [candidate division Zixibacteria bacterium]